MKLRLTPLHADPHDLGIENGERIWEAKTLDPAFLASLPEDAPPLAPGWHRASARLDNRSGDVHRPRIYIPDAAGHYAEERSVEMLREGAAYTAEFLLALPVASLRFDPSMSRCEFACDALDVEVIEGPRPRAAVPVTQPERSAAREQPRWRRVLRRFASRAGVRWTTLRAGDRKTRVLQTIDRAGFGIEIGPSHDPIAPKREGFKVEIIDHANREELLAKYATHPVSVDRIEEVDYVWRGESYLELTGKPKHYDWIIASHLIEHTPDLIAFLADCDSILKDDGVLSLVIPDKRYIFDRFRPITGLARIIDSHLLPRSSHSPGAVAEHYMNVAGKAHQLSWDAATEGDYVFIHSAREAKEVIREAKGEGAYRDVHNWCFVPHSFRLLMNDLYVLGYTKLREVSFQPTEGFEFYVTLGRRGRGPPLSRLQMLKAIDVELAAVNDG